MAVSIGGGIVKDGLVFHLTQNNLNAYRGKPTTNISAQGLNVFNGLTGTYIGLENGWKKYSISGTWNSGTYPYSMNIGSTTHTGGIAYSARMLIKTNVRHKFDLWGGINYVNDPNMTSGGTSTVTSLGFDKDGNEIQEWRRDGYIYSTGYGGGSASNPGYMVTRPAGNGTTFNASTDFVWTKEIQVEQNSFCTPYVDGTRATTGVFYDATGNHTINAASMNYPTDGTANFTAQAHNITVDSNTFTMPLEKTLSIWIKSDRPLSVTDNWEVGFVNQGSVSGSMFGFMYGVGSCQDLGFWGYGSPYDMSVESTTNKWSSDGNWHNGVLTMDASRNVRVYVDGVAKQFLKHSDYTTLADYVTMPTNTTNYFLINSRGVWNSGMTYVNLDDVMVYDRALTAKEVAQNYEAGRALHGL